MPGLDIHAGMWKALYQAGIDATHCIGTSAGAIISGVDAAGHNPNAFTAFLAELADDDVRHERFMWKARFAWIDYFMENDRILKIIRDWMPQNAGKYFKSLRVVTTQVKDGKEEIWHTQNFVTNWDVTLLVLASMSICGVFPAVTIRGEEYVDGGVRANLPLPDDWELYDEIYLLIAAGRPEFYHKENGLLTHLIKNVQWLMQDQIEDVIERTKMFPKVHVLRPPLDTPKGTLRFDHDLIDQAYQWTASQLNMKSQIQNP